MMPRQNYTYNNNEIALYCNFLEYRANEYEYITYIMNDSDIVDYCTMDDDVTDTTFIVYFNIREEDVDKIHNVKVVAKLKDKNEFEVGCLYVKSEAIETKEIIGEKISVDDYSAMDGIVIPFNSDKINLETTKLEVVSLG